MENVNRVYVFDTTLRDGEQSPGASLNFHENGRAWWSEVPGILYIDLPESLCDEQMTVVAVTLKEPLVLQVKY